MGNLYQQWQLFTVSNNKNGLKSVISCVRVGLIDCSQSGPSESESLSDWVGVSVSPTPVGDHFPLEQSELS